DQATVMVVIHPELLSADPTSAADIQLNIVQPNGATVELGMQLDGLGPATPQQTPGQPNPAGWATLTPIPNPGNGHQPFRNQTARHQGLIQYHPDWSAQIAEFGAAASALSQGLGQVKNDPIYGADVTSLDPSTTPPSLAGALWKRHDGFTTIDESPGGGAV